MGSDSAASASDIVISGGAIDIVIGGGRRRRPACGEGVGGREQLGGDGAHADGVAPRLPPPVSLLLVQELPHLRHEVALLQAYIPVT